MAPKKIIHGGPYTPGNSFDPSNAADINMFNDMVSSVPPGYQPIPVPPPTLVTEKVQLIMMPIFQCPECMYILNSEYIDNIRVQIYHPMHSKCSKSNTKIIRPIATFMREV